MRKWGIDMKKNKNLVRVSIVASLLITTSSILGQNVEVMASNPTNYKDMTEYAASAITFSYAAYSVISL